MIMLCRNLCDQLSMPVLCSLLLETHVHVSCYTVNLENFRSWLIFVLIAGFEK